MSAIAPSLSVNPASTASKPKVASSEKQSVGMFCMWHGLSISQFARFLAMGPSVRWSRVPRLSGVAALSLSNSLWNAVEQARFGRQIAATSITEPPVFILGHWRSGTTLLHNLMTLDPQFTFPNTYQVVFPGHFLSTEKIVTRLTAPLLPKTRPMDNMAAGWDLPQEDEVALALLTLLSPYVMTALPNSFDVYNRFSDLTQLTPSELAAWKQAFSYFMKKLTIRQNRPIIVKSPTHTYRIPTLLEMFPNAKFVYVYRDPYAVVSSSIHLRKTIFEENGFGVVDAARIPSDTVRMYDECIRRYEATKSLIPDGRLVEVRFEDLEADPHDQMRRVYDRLDLPNWDVAGAKIEAQLPSLKQYRKNSFRMDPDLMRMIHERLSYVFAMYGYSNRRDAA